MSIKQLPESGGESQVGCSLKRYRGGRVGFPNCSDPIMHHSDTVSALVFKSYFAVVDDIRLLSFEHLIPILSQIALELAQNTSKYIFSLHLLFGWPSSY